MSEDYLPLTATILATLPRIEDNFIFSLRPESPLDVAPGQFIEITLPGIGSFPVSLCSAATRESLRVCVRRAGRVTTAFSRLQSGDTVGLRGPFGNGFPLEDFRGRDILLLAGGIGIAPLIALLEALLAKRDAFGDLTLLYGAAHPGDFLFLGELTRLTQSGLIDLKLSVDSAPVLPWQHPGATCVTGWVSSLLEAPPRPTGTVAVLCGPPGLYQSLLEPLADYGIPPAQIFATLERRMRCGVSVCCHCVAGGRFVCRDGPVFNLEQLRRMAGAI